MFGLVKRMEDIWLLGGRKRKEQGVIWTPSPPVHTGTSNHGNLPEGKRTKVPSSHILYLTHT